MNRILSYVQLDSRKWPEGISDGLTLPCGVCNVIPHFDYTVNDSIWKTLVPKEKRLGVICLPCLDNLATKEGIDISLHLERIQYTGKGKTILLKPMKAYYWEKAHV